MFVNSKYLDILTVTLSVFSKVTAKKYAYFLFTGGYSSSRTNERTIDGEKGQSLAGAIDAAKAAARRCMMHAAAAALIVATVATACVWSGLLWQLWVLRHTFEIAARAPGLVGVCGVASLVVVLLVLVHWILLYEAQGLPCYVTLLSSYLCECLYYVRYCCISVLNLGGRETTFRDIPGYEYMIPAVFVRTHTLGLLVRQIQWYVSGTYHTRYSIYYHINT